MTYRILVSDPLDPSGLEQLRASGAEVTQLREEDRPRLAELLPGYDALVVRSMTKVTRELLEAGTDLKVVGRAGIGVDNVDVAAATEQGVLVVNAPTANLISATEHTFALLLAVARKVPAAHASLSSGEWNRKPFVGTELQGKTLGVVGFGRIGQAVARRAQAFDMDVVAFDPYLAPAAAARLDVELLPLEQVLGRADVVTLHVPLTDGTRHLLGAEQFARMRDGVILVNCARGGVVDEEALLDALESGKVAAAGVDVFAQEPPEDYRLMEHPRVVVTPHIGAQTREAQERISTDTAKMVLAALEGSLAITAVNLPFRPAGSRMEPWLRLGEQLGRLAASLLPGGLRRCQVDLWGLDDELRIPVAVAVLRGGLMPALGEAVNYVNAERLAESRGIEVVRSTHSADESQRRLVGVTLTGDDGTVELAGTLFEGRDPRVVRYQGFPLEFRPEGRLLVLANRDEPGTVGRIGGVLGDEGINIADIHLARRPEGVAASAPVLAVLRIDQELSAEGLKKLRAVPQVESVRSVDLGG
jgi:D-3-phosphoglycerate dehydrogenase / 2-oxoglutarate reductase